MAKGLKCTCICGGRNHGVGSERAAQNVQALSVEWLNELEAIANRQEIARLKAAASQLSLELY